MIMRIITLKRQKHITQTQLKSTTNPTYIPGDFSFEIADEFSFDLDNK